MTEQTCKTCRFCVDVKVIDILGPAKDEQRCTRYPPHPKYQLPKPLIGMGCGEWAAKPQQEDREA